jgi:hypothetical protein
MPAWYHACHAPESAVRHEKKPQDDLDNGNIWR